MLRYTSIKVHAILLEATVYTSISNVIFGGERSFKPTSTASRLILVHSSSTTIHPQLPQHLPNHAQKPGDEPLPSHEGCGLNHQHPGCAEQKAATPAPFQTDVGRLILDRGNWRNRRRNGEWKNEGGPRNWEAHLVRHETNHDLPSWFVSPILPSISPH